MKLDSHIEFLSETLSKRSYEKLLLNLPPRYKRMSGITFKQLEKLNEYIRNK